MLPVKDPSLAWSDEVPSLSASKSMDSSAFSFFTIACLALRMAFSAFLFRMASLAPMVSVSDDFPILTAGEDCLEDLECEGDAGVDSGRDSSSLGCEPSVVRNSAVWASFAFLAALSSAFFVAFACAARKEAVASFFFKALSDSNTASSSLSCDFAFSFAAAAFAKLFVAAAFAAFSFVAFSRRSVAAFFTGGADKDDEPGFEGEGV